MALLAVEDPGQTFLACLIVHGIILWVWLFNVSDMAVLWMLFNLH